MNSIVLHTPSDRNHSSKVITNNAGTYCDNLRIMTNEGIVPYILIMDDNIAMNLTMSC